MHGVPPVFAVSTGRLSRAEVGGGDVAVVEQFGAGSREHDAAAFHDVGAVGDRERAARVLLDEQDRGAVARVRRAMIAKISSTSLGARPIDGSSSSSAFGPAASARAIASICCSPPESEPAGDVAARAQDREALEEPADRRRSRLRRAPPPRLADFPRRSSARACAGLRERAAARADERVRRELGDVGAVEDDAAAAFGDDRRDREQQRRLAGAVRADDRAQRAGFERDVDVVQDVDLAVAGAQAGRLRAAPLRSCLRRCRGTLR